MRQENQRYRHTYSYVFRSQGGTPQQPQPQQQMQQRPVATLIPDHLVPRDPLQVPDDLSFNPNLSPIDINESDFMINQCAQNEQINGNTVARPPMDNSNSAPAKQVAPSKVTNKKRTYTRRPKPKSFDGLTDDLSASFSQWFYGGANEFRRRPRTELYPIDDPQSAQFTDCHLEPQKLHLLTENLHKGPPKIEELKCHRLDMEELRSEEIVFPFAYNRLTPRIKVHTKINFKLSTSSGIVDRRSLCKRRAKPTSEESFCSLPDESLILPEEDCDDSDYEEIVEINCDS